MQKQNRVLALIILSQFMCTSLWFAGNAIIKDLILDLGIDWDDLGTIVSMVQFGFIIGTFFYAYFTIADRFNPSKVFFISAVLGAVANVLLVIDGVTFSQLLLLRFLTGFFLAGIYPVGMKIAADYYEKGLGKALSFLVGALVLGTALPHLITSLGSNLEWRNVLYATSSLALIGGSLIYFFVPEGPFRKKSQKLQFASMFKAFKDKNFQAASFGYFGHMWELYAFWVFIPIILEYYNFLGGANLNVPLWSFVIIGLGALACFIGGFLSDKFGSKKVATWALILSGACCLFSPLMFILPSMVFIGFIVFWGLVVIADSPLFSALVATHANPEIKGTALTTVTSIGFAISIISIQLIGWLMKVIPSENAYLFLAAGPLLGVVALLTKKAGH